MFKNQGKPEIKDLKHFCEGRGATSVLIEPHREKTGFLPMRKQRRRSASQ